MKKIILAVSTISAIVILIMYICQAPFFLGVEIIETVEFDEIISDLTETKNISKENVFFEDSALIFDENTDTYFITVGDAIIGNFVVNTDTQLYWLQNSEKVNIPENFENLIAENFTFSLGIISEEQYEIINVKISTLPFIHIESETVPTDRSALEPYESGSVTVIEPQNKENGRYTVDTYNMEYKVRGQTSAYLDKKPYKFRLLNSEQERLSESILQLRKDDDWNLNAVYGDNSKIREAVCFDILNDIMEQSDTKHSHPQNSEFCELFINETYAGIYQLIEPMDAKQADINDATDFYYKFNGLKAPPVEAFYEWPDTDMEEHLSLIPKNFPAEAQDNRYDPIIDFISVVAYNDTYFKDELTIERFSSVSDINNLIDTSIAKAVLDLTDNDPKNMYLVSREQQDGSYITYKELYDFNYSFADFYSSENEMYTARKTEHSVDLGYIIDKIFQSKDFEELKIIYTERYLELRSTAISEENFVEIINKHFKSLYNAGAYGRDFELWDLDVDLQYEYDFLIDFTKNQLYAVDEYISNLDTRYNK